MTSDFILGWFTDKDKEYILEKYDSSDILMKIYDKLIQKEEEDPKGINVKEIQEIKEYVRQLFTNKPKRLALLKRNEKENFMIMQITGEKAEEEETREQEQEKKGIGEMLKNALKREDKKEE